MRIFLRSVWFLLLVPGLAFGQTAAHPADPSTNLSDVGAQLDALRDALLRTQQQVAEQQQEIQLLKTQLKVGQSGTAGAALVSAVEVVRPNSRPANGDLSDPSPDIHNLTANPVAPSADQKTQQGEQQPPLGSIKLGDALITPGGFVDFENIFRTTNTQSNIATNFAGIPFSNTAQGRDTELRTTAQFSRINLKVEDKFRGYDLMAYVEADFSGNSAPGVYQSVNGVTNRLRLYFGYVRRGNWEFLGGQTWSWLTPNRNGIGPIPSDLAITYNEDQNLGVGVPYTRAAELRAAYHVNDHWAIGVGIENSNQYIGNYVALPSQFSAIGSQFDNNANAGAANLMPDIIAKTTYDTPLLGRHFHAELTGFLTGAHASAIPVGSTEFKGHNAFGGGGQVAANYELIPNKLVVLANAFWSDGGAHYLVGTGPELVVRPDAAGTDVSLSMVRAGAGSAGLEWRASQKQAFAAYYGADYYGRNFFPDTTNTTTPSTIIGYGGPGSPNTNNRAIQQITFDWLLTFWKTERHGALQYYTQYSYLTRAPWFVAPNNPRDAHLSMVYAGVRYVLPSTSGTLLRVPYPN
ncbi:MAG: hypothetical protein ABSB66_04565 [Candidatus Acidiferrales bacterium]